MILKPKDIKKLLNDKRVRDAINKHLWIESQKAGYSIGMEHATDEWIDISSMVQFYQIAQEYLTKKLL